MLYLYKFVFVKNIFFLMKKRKIKFKMKPTNFANFLQGYIVYAI